MQQSEPLFPAFTDRASYEAMRPDVNVWLRAMRVICQRHGLPIEGLVRFGDGTDLAFGTTIVFAIGEHYVIKLYPPYLTQLFEAERTVAKYVYGKLSVSTPEIYAQDSLEGWPYLVMSRLQGVYLSDIWDTLEDTNQLRIVIELAEVVAQLHALPTHDLSLLEANWSAWVADQVKRCVQHHQEQGVPEYWLQQIPGYLECAAPLYPLDFPPSIVSGDIHQYHLLARQEHGQWRLCGMFDFDDGRIGFSEYDLAAAGLFLMAGRPELLRTFLLTYGYAESAIDEHLSHRLMAYTLLHPYRPFNWVREAFTKRPCPTLKELAEVIYAFE